MGVLNSPRVQAAMTAVHADQEQLAKDRAEAEAARVIAEAAKRVAENAAQHYALDVQALYDEIESETGIAPKGRA